MTDPAGLVLDDPDGRPARLQAMPLARWSGGSVKWLLLDFVTGPTDPGTARWVLRPGRPKRPIERQTAPATLPQGKAPRPFVVETGAATFHLRPDALLFEQVSVGGMELLAPNSAKVVLTDAIGQTHKPRIESCEVEAGGPVRTTVRFEGTFRGAAPCRFRVRICFFADTGLVRVRFTLHNPRRARHRGGLWDLGDPGSVLFRDLSLELALGGSGSTQTVWRAEPAAEERSIVDNRLEIYQDSSGGVNWRSTNHVNHDGRVPCFFRGYRVRAGMEDSSGLRASPIVSLRRAGGTVSAALPEFWQQFPKAIEAEAGRLHVRLFPWQFADLFELQGGEQKTHTVWLHFGPPGQSSDLLDWVHQPALAMAAPAWYAASGALPHLSPAAMPPNQLDEYLAAAVDGPNSVFARREIIDEYGWRNYGELYADHEGAYYRGPSPVISHYNNQYDVIQGTLLQWLRTGESKWLELCVPLARHVIDIDIYHTSQDKAAYNGGLFWHTDHYQDAAACTHRTFSKANQPPGRSYGGGPCGEHNYTTGLLHYYYLTGDANAQDAVRGLADWVVFMDDGRRNILGLLDAGATGQASRTRDSDHHGPGRGCGNSVNALLDGYLATDNRAFLDKAECLVRRCIHPKDDVASLGLLDAENRWSYTVFLSALGRYLEIKAEAGELDFMHAYARASLLRFADWMVVNEIPYLDRPEKLEYPTETWAAQDMRKANVLRLAAAYADEPLRTSLLRRAAEIADRSWSDLLRFESRAATRPLAVMMIEGLRDAYFRSFGVRSVPSPRAEPDFGNPSAFIPQRRRILKQLKTVRGIAAAVAKLLNPLNWRKRF